MMACQDLNVMFVVLLTAPGDIGLLLVGNHFAWQHIAIVVGTSNIDVITIRIIAGMDGKWRQILIDVCRYPGVICKV